MPGFFISVFRQTKGWGIALAKEQIGKELNRGNSSETQSEIIIASNCEKQMRRTHEKS
jgi:hypothetical protein